MKHDAHPHPRLVRYHPPVGLSALFRPLPKQGGLRPTLDVSYTASAGGPTLRFSAREALGIPEQTLLLVLLELAGEHHASEDRSVLLDNTSDDVVGSSLWTLLNKGASGASGQTVRFETSWYELNRRCGATQSGANQRLRRTQLQRLCEVVVWETAADARQTIQQSFLVAWLVGDDDRIHLALNGRLASALLGARYAQVWLAERFSLPSDVAMALHTFLSTVLRVGRGFPIGVDTLVERLWPGSAATAPQGTHRRRRKDVRDGLRAMAALPGWSVAWPRADLAEVRRGQARVRDSTRVQPRRNANATTFHRERREVEHAFQNNGLQVLDASGLFLTKAN